MRGLASLADRPHDQRLAAPHVAACEHLVDRRLIALGVRLDVAARIERQPGAFRSCPRAPGGQSPWRAGRAPPWMLNSVPAMGLNCRRPAARRRPDASVLADGFLGEHRKVALGAFLMARGGAQLEGARRPRCSLVLLSGRWRVMISSLVTETAPWRSAVPMQSEPVSPPPMTTTCFPLARMGCASPSGYAATAGSAAARIPLRSECRGGSRPGIGSSRLFSAPPASATASEVVQQPPRAGTLMPTWAL